MLRAMATLDLPSGSSSSAKSGTNFIVSPDIAALLRTPPALAADRPAMAGAWHRMESLFYMVGCIHISTRMHVHTEIMYDDRTCSHASISRCIASGAGSFYIKRAM